jgi:integrase
VASLSTDKKGNRRIIFTNSNGERKAIYLGKMNKKTADNYLVRIEHLISAVFANNSPDAETSAWIGDLGNVMYGKLVAVALVQPRVSELDAAPNDITISAFLDQYLNSRTDIKPSTRTNLEQVRRNLLEFFGPSKLLRAISPGDADEFRIFLMGKLADNTARRNCGRAKQFFRAAVRKKIIAENPFADMKGCGVKANESRYYFITRDEAQQVIDACPDAQWRLLFALSRYGGLRCPSEHLGLRWGDIDWERGRMLIHSPKTEHHEGGESRLVPIFPELRPHLDEVYHQAPPGTEYVITRYRQANVNLRTQLIRIIERAGLSPWPKLFQNLRATRATELCELFPGHVAAKWLGHCERVADKHYRQVTEDHFKRAVDGNAECDAPATQIPTQPTSAAIRLEGQETHKALVGQGLYHFQADVGEYCTPVQAPRQGLEPWTKRLTAACSTN